MNLGNQLNRIVDSSRRALFEQGELAQLTFGAFDIAATALQSNEQSEIQVTFPVGYRPDRTAIQSTRTYRKDQLLLRYQFLAFHQLTVNALVQLVVIVETMLSDVLRAVILRFPQKIGAKRTIPLQTVFECTNLEDLHLRAGDTLLNELAYKSPADFAEAFQQLLSVNLLECPAFHRYVEIKATRDIFVHNRGVANEVYSRKAGSHARARSGADLPADLQYFLESYEHCLQVSEWLEAQLHSHWHSSEYEDRQRQQPELPFPDAPNAQTGEPQKTSSGA